MSTIELTCTHCNKLFLRRKADYNRQIKLGTINFFCSTKCHLLHQTQNSFVNNFHNCINCDKLTLNPKFCSRVCAAITNNKINPKRKLNSFCKDCRVLIATKSKYCKKCWLAEKTKPLKDLTLAEATNAKVTRSAAFAFVRTRAKLICPYKPCEKCGYDKHTEVAHIKPISSYPTNTLLSEINHPSNLLRLCPNCHWEVDYGEAGWIRTNMGTQIPLP